MRFTRNSSTFAVIKIISLENLEAEFFETVIYKKCLFALGNNSRILIVKGSSRLWSLHFNWKIGGFLGRKKDLNWLLLKLTDVSDHQWAIFNRISKNSLTGSWQLTDKTYDRENWQTHFRRVNPTTLSESMWLISLHFHRSINSEVAYWGAFVFLACWHHVVRWPTERSRNSL